MVAWSQVLYPLELTTSDQKRNKSLKQESVASFDKSGVRPAGGRWFSKYWQEYGGRNGPVHPTLHIKDGSIMLSRVLQVTDVELEHILHACKQCLGRVSIWNTELRGLFGKKSWNKV